MTKQEFLSNLNWAKVRWPNFSFDKNTVASLYDDYKGFSSTALAKALRLLYNGGNSYLDLPKLFKLTKDCYNDELTSLPQLPQPKIKNGLKDYLDKNNFKNLKDAIRYTKNNKE